MNSADFPDGSRENPAIIHDTDADEEAHPSNFADGFRDNPAIIPESDDDEEEALPPFESSALDKLCQVAKMIQDRERLRNRQEEEMDEWRRRWDAEQAERLKKHDYEVAKAYAHDLHSQQSPTNIFQKESNEEEEEEGEGDTTGKGKSQFTDAKKAIKKRRKYSISGTTTTTTCGGTELSLTTTQRTAPTLVDLSMRVLAQNSEAIKSLYLVPDHLKKKLSNLVIDSRKVNKRFMQLLTQDSPSEVSARNCVDLEDKDLTQILCNCDRGSLEVLKLDLCGRGMTEKAITEFLKRSAYGFPSLTTLSLQGAFCLTDNALALISRSAPLLRLINLSDCSLLTFQAVKILADNFGSTLRGLNIGGCQGIKPSNVFRNSLSKFEKLSYLSVARLESIHDVVVEFFTSRGSNLTDLSLASCTGLNDGTIWTVGRYCPKLEALDISELDNLSDASLKEITDGCRSLNDEAVAAFLEVCGSSLNQLCLNNVRDVGQHTAILLAQNCKRLHYLDLSWCRKLTEEELRRILCCCSLLRSLKLFGWTQMKGEFLEELSRSQVHIVGLKMSSVFAHPDDSYPSVDASFSEE